MERKKIFRSVWFWVVLVIVVALGFSSLFQGSGGFQQVKTSEAIAQFAAGNVESATINDKEQTLDLVLKREVEGSKKISASYPIGGADDIFTLVTVTRGWAPYTYEPSDCSTRLKLRLTSSATCFCRFDSMFVVVVSCRGQIQWFQVR